MSTEQDGRVAAVSGRRQSMRLAVAIPMFMRGTDAEGKPFVDFATAMNIGAGGALLVSKRSLPTGAELTLEIPISFLPRALLPKLVRQIQACLLRVEPAEKCFLMGVRFANPLCVNNSETSSPSTITVGAEKDSHLRT